jgi:glycerophosphoryl diester phosphodiesterase
MELRRGERGVLRIGHRGAAALALENTLESLERALEHAVDLVEIDVLDTRDGRLVLAHSNDLFEVSHGAVRGRVRPLTLAELRRAAPQVPTLDEALELLAGGASAAGVLVDLKGRGFERPVVEALRRHRLIERAVVSSFHRTSLAALREAEPRLRVGLTYPEDRYGVSRRRPLLPLVAGALFALRRTLPYRLDGWLHRTGAAAATLHWAVASRAAIERCHARGAAALAWTVDDPALAARLVRAGIDGIITNDPRILEGLTTT